MHSFIKTFSFIIIILMPIVTHSSQGNIWNDESEMAKYYGAIHDIRQNLDIITTGNGFDSWPEPNPYWHRTPQYLFLEIELLKNGNKQLRQLYTPFGEMELLSGGLQQDFWTYSASFLDIMKNKWDICDVTDSVKVYSYSASDEKQYGPFVYQTIPLPEFQREKQLYLIKSVGNIVLFSENECSELIIYDQVDTGKQYELDKELFSKLSGGRNHF